jgi:hypothetical protein
MVISFFIAIYFKWIYKGDMEASMQLVIGVLITTIGWITITLLTKPEDDAVLSRFYQKVRPHDFGWKTWLKKSGIKSESSGGGIGKEVLAMVLGCLMVYGYLFGMGYWIYGEGMNAIIWILVGVVCSFSLWKLWGKLSFS